MRINVNTSQPSVFISSTFLDLKNERFEVATVLKEYGMRVNALDVSPASSENSKSRIIDGITESDFVILILADRYGSIIPKMTGSSTLSITHWEYNVAQAKNKNVLAFFMDWGTVEKKDPTKFDGKDDPHYKLKHAGLQKFKSTVSDKHNVRYANSGFELASLVSESLIPVYREGVRSLLKKQASLMDDLEVARKRITQLETKVLHSGTPVESLGRQLSLASVGLSGLADLAPKTESTGLYKALASKVDQPLKPTLGIGLLQGINPSLPKK